LINRLRYLIFISIIALLVGCRAHKDTAKLKAVRNIRLVDNLEESQLDYDWFGTKLSTSIDDGKSKKSFKTNVRVRKDSMIWLSISPLLGIEMARVIITPDSIKFIDKINNQYFKGDLNYLSEQKNINLDFSVLQEMIVADALMFDPTEKFKSIKGEDNYMITAKTKRKVRKAVGLLNGKDGGVMTMDTVLLQIDEKKYRKAIKKNVEEDLIIKRYWLSPDYSRAVRTLISDILYDRNIVANYSDFELFQDSIYFPRKIDYIFSEKESSVKINLKYSKLKLNQKVSFPFTIPKDFSRLEVENKK
jgi:hypothetical protein